MLKVKFFKKKKSVILIRKTAFWAYKVELNSLEFFGRMSKLQVVY